MNNTVYDVDYTRLLPQSLKSDETVLALAKCIAGALQDNIELARIAIIYPRIDELDETTLDILARDLHVDWYDDTYPIEAKRAVIKSSVRVHKRLGTKFAVVQAIRDIYPNSEVQEWFEYGGTHHRFRIILDLTNAKVSLDLTQIIKAAKFYKRLSAHLDEIICKMSANTEVFTGTAVTSFSKKIRAEIICNDNSVFSTKTECVVGATAAISVKRIGSSFEYTADNPVTIEASGTVGAATNSFAKKLRLEVSI